MKNSTKRVVWITGASSGIGASLASTFAEHGDRIVATARTESKLQELAQNISDRTGQCSIISGDVRNESFINSAVQQIISTHGSIDVLVNNAGVSYFKEFVETSVEEFDHVIQTNLRGAFLATKAVMPGMLERRTGLIMNVVSYIVKEVFTKSAAYAASKAGLEAMMNVLRAEVRQSGINIVNVYPGAVATPIWHQKQISKYGNQMLTPEEVAQVMYQVSIQPPSLMVEEMILRPQGGNLHSP